MSQYFPKQFWNFEGNISVKVDLSNYSTKTDQKDVTHANNSSFASEVDKLDIYKLVPFCVGLSKLSDVNKNDVVKITVYHKLAAKVNNIDTSEFVLRTKYQADKTKLEKKISDVTDFVKKQTHWIRK